MKGQGNLPFSYLKKPLIKIFWLDQLKVYKSGTFFCQNGIQKGKELDLGAEPPRIKLGRVAARTDAQEHSKPSTS